MAASGMTRSKYRSLGLVELNVRLPVLLLEDLVEAARHRRNFWLGRNRAGKVRPMPDYYHFGERHRTVTVKETVRL